MTDAQWGRRTRRRLSGHAGRDSSTPSRTRCPHCGAARRCAARMDVRRGNVSGLRARMHACFDLHPEARPDWTRALPVVGGHAGRPDRHRRDPAPGKRAPSTRSVAGAGRCQALYAALCTYADELARAGDFAEARHAWRSRRARTAGMADAAADDAAVRIAARSQCMPRMRPAIACTAAKSCAWRSRPVRRASPMAARLGLGDAALLAEDYDEAATLSREVADAMRTENVHSRARSRSRISQRARASRRPARRSRGGRRIAASDAAQRSGR